MRKFFVELVLSVTLITIGVGLCFFEFSDYDTVSYTQAMDMESIEYTVNKEHPLRLELDDDLMVRYAYEEDMGDRVKIEFSSLLRYKQKDDYLKIKDLSWRWNAWKPYYDAMIEGLKDHKIVTFHDSHHMDVEMVVITCSKESEKWMDVYH